MASLTTLAATDKLSDSRTDINDNFDGILDGDIALTTPALGAATYTTLVGGAITTSGVIDMTNCIDNGIKQDTTDDNRGIYNFIYENGAKRWIWGKVYNTDDFFIERWTGASGSEANQGKPFLIDSGTGNVTFDGNLSGIGTLGCGAIITNNNFNLSWIPSATVEQSKSIIIRANDGTKNPRIFIKQTVDIDNNVHKFIFDSAFNTVIGYADFEFLHGDVSFSSGNLSTTGTLACGAITSTGGTNFSSNDTKIVRGTKAMTGSAVDVAMVQLGVSWEGIILKVEAVEGGSGAVGSKKEVSTWIGHSSITPSQTGSTTVSWSHGGLTITYTPDATGGITIALTGTNTHHEMFEISIMGGKTAGSSSATLTLL